MEKQYFLKLKTNEKIMVSESAYNEWVHNYNGDNISLITRNGITINVKKKDIVIAGEIPVRSEEVVNTKLKK